MNFHEQIPEMCSYRGKKINSLKITPTAANHVKPHFRSTQQKHNSKSTVSQEGQ